MWTANSHVYFLVFLLLFFTTNLLVHMIKADFSHLTLGHFPSVLVLFWHFLSALVLQCPRPFCLAVSCPVDVTSAQWRATCGPFSQGTLSWGPVEGTLSWPPVLVVISVVIGWSLLEIYS